VDVCEEDDDTFTCTLKCFGVGLACVLAFIVVLWWWFDCWTWEW
jgi:hypothetical protein